MVEKELPKLQSSFSVDCVLFGFDDGELKILLIERNKQPFKEWKAIPGNLVHQDEDLDAAAARILYELTGLREVYLQQFHSFGKIDRHPQGRVVTVAYYAIIKRTEYGLHPVTNYAKKAFWWPANSLPDLAFDHNEIAQKAIEKLRNEINREPLGFELLEENFTLTQLQHLYEVILEKNIDKRNFRKKILGFGLLTEVKKKRTGVSHRPADLYKFNKKKYQALTESVFVFEI